MFVVSDPEILGITCYVAANDQYRYAPNFQVIFGVMIVIH